MRTFNAAAQAQREARAGNKEFYLIWLSPSDFDTGDEVGVGIWTGRDDETIAVTDQFTGITQARAFYARGLLEIGAIRYAAGLSIYPLSVRLSSISDAVISAFRAYNARGAKAQIWRRTYVPGTLEEVGIEPVYRGFVNRATFNRPSPGEMGSVDAEIINTTRVLTFPSARRKSHEAQKKRNNDKFRIYKNIAPQRDIGWGVED